jgi:putative transposase
MERNLSERIQAIGIKEIMTAPRSPWQNPLCERLIGSIRRDCLNHVVILGESHLRKILGRYLHYYHKYRTHLSLEKDAPEPRPIQEVSLGAVIEIPEVGGLHHHYERRAA